MTDADSYLWDTVLRPSLLTVYQVAPEKLELNTLWENMRLLGSNTQKTTRFEIAFWNKVFYPAAVLVMMIVALPFSYFQRRQGGVGFRIFAGTMLGLTFFLIGRLFSNLGVLNDWPRAVFGGVPARGLHHAHRCDALVARAALSGEKNPGARAGISRSRRPLAAGEPSPDRA